MQKQEENEEKYMQSIFQKFFESDSFFGVGEYRKGYAKQQLGFARSNGEQKSGGMIATFKYVLIKAGYYVTPQQMIRDKKKSSIVNKK